MFVWIFHVNLSARCHGLFRISLKKLQKSFAENQPLRTKSSEIVHASGKEAMKQADQLILGVQEMHGYFRSKTRTENSNICFFSKNKQYCENPTLIM